MLEATRAEWRRRARQQAEAEAGIAIAPGVTDREQLFPPCQLQTCARAGTPHSCLLPHQIEGFEATERIVAMVGGYGAAKTVWAVAVGLALTLQIPRNVGFVLRRSYPKLRDSVLRVYLETLDRAGVRYQTADHEKGMPHRLVIEANGSEIRFRESRDVGRLLSTECGWFHLEEAGEEPQSTFSYLLGRLRLQAAAGYLRGLLTSNPPGHQHWLPALFGMQAGVRALGDPETGDQLKTRLIMVSSRENPHLPAGYVTALVATHAAHDVRRLVKGEFGFVAEGRPVYGRFVPGKHVRQLEPLPKMAMVRSWDFGYRAPAVTWHQFPKCHHGRIHWRVVHEYAGHDLDAEKLAEVVFAETKALQQEQQAQTPLPPGLDGMLLRSAPPVVTDCGDHAGSHRSDAGASAIIRLSRHPFNLKFRHKPVKNIDPGLALIRLALSEEDCACGDPTFLVAARCKHTVDALAGGYHYKELKPGQQHTEASGKPMKDGFYDNLADTLRYAGENHYRALRRDPSLLADLAPRDERPRHQARGYVGHPWSWMEGGRRVG